MAILATVWGIRLTWNFNRRGGYKWPPWHGDEDYRWKILQDGFFLPILTNKFAWIIFNFTFISFYQPFLLWLIASPSTLAWSMANSPDCNQQPFQVLGLDGLATLLILFFIVMESIADNQQYEFQTEKYRRRATNDPSLLEGDYADGFLHSTGLFTIVRKPNYMAEQAIWISFYLFSISASGSVWNWSLLGFVQLCLLFQGSGYLTELITVTKYPKYKEYMRTVPLYVPSIFALARHDEKTD